MAFMIKEIIPEYLYNAINYACSDSTFNLGIPQTSDGITELLENGLYIKKTVENILSPLTTSPESTFDIIMRQLETYAQPEKMQFYTIMSISGNAYSQMQSIIENQNNTLKYQYDGQRLDDFISSKNHWHYIVDRIILYQSRMFTPRNIKGHFSLETGEIFENRLYNPNDWYIGK